MAITGTIIGVGVLGASAVSTVQQADAAGQAQKEAKQQLDAQQAQEQKALDDAKAQEQTQKDQQALLEKRNSDEMNMNREKWDADRTIYTGPLGLASKPGAAAGKSYLGQ